jgi:hypothetical protein
MGVRKYVVENINKRLGIIMEALEIAIEAGVMTGRVCSLKEFLQKDLQTDEHFYKNAVSTFIARISSMDELTRWKQDLPSKNRLKQIQVGWLGRIDTLQQLIATCDALEGRRSSLFLRVMDIVKELEGPPLIRDSCY